MSRRWPTFTLIELLVVVTIIAILTAMLLPALGRARETTRRSVCAANLRQFHMALQMYADVYVRYPHQRNTQPGTWTVNGITATFGGPMLYGLNLLSVPSSAVGWEADALIEMIGGQIVKRASAPYPDGAKVLSCPNLANALAGYQPPQPSDFHGFYPFRDSYWPNGTGQSASQGNWNDACYSASYGYAWLGGSHYWSVAGTPTYSPLRPEDDPEWALVADMILYYTTTGWFGPHMERGGLPAGGQHLFNDGHVVWVEFAGGTSMINVAHATWARRRVTAP